MNQFIALTHHFTIFEYVQFSLFFSLLVILFTLLANAWSEKFNISMSMLSMTLILTPVIYLLLTFGFAYITKSELTTFTSFPLYILSISTLFSLVYLFEEKSMVKNILFSLLLILLLSPLLYLQILPLIPAVIASVTHFLVSIIISSFAKRYHA